LKPLTPINSSTGSTIIIAILKAITIDKTVIIMATEVNIIRNTNKADIVIRNNLEGIQEDIFMI